MTDAIAITDFWLDDEQGRDALAALADIREHIGRYSAEGNPQLSLRASIELADAKGRPWNDVHLRFATDTELRLCRDHIVAPEEARYLLPGNYWLESDRIRNWFLDLAVRFIPGVVKKRWLIDGVGTWIGVKIGMVASFNEERSSHSSLSWDLALPTS